MTTPRRPAPSPTPAEPDDPRARTIGIVLIAAALLIGVVLLAKGFSQEDSLVATDVPEDDRATTTTVATGGGVEETTTTAAPVANPPASVSVIVANGSGATGVAGTNAETLEAAGYTTVETTNAPTTSTSNVFYASAAQADAQAIATALGFDQSPVTPMPVPPPVELAGATVLVVIGSDRA